MLTSQPTFNYQSDPLLNISPLIHLYSECLTHVVETDGLFQLPAHKSPIILSHERTILNSSLAYESAFARVRSPRCLLTIASIFFSWNYTKDTLREYIAPKRYTMTPETPTSTFTGISPQSVIIFTNQDARSLYACEQYEDLCYRGQTLYFTLQLNKNLNSLQRIFGVLRQDMTGSLAFNCSTFEYCKCEIDHTTDVFAKHFNGSWEFHSRARNFRGGHPFERGSQGGLDQGIKEFVLGTKRPSVEFQIMHPPAFSLARPIRHLAPIELILTGKTASIKLVTTAGVFTPKNSYRLYFLPFLPTVWLGVLISAGISLGTILGAFRMERTQGLEVGLIHLAVELATWMFAVTIGQFKNSGIPLVTGRLRREVVWIVTPVVVSWLLLSAFIVNVYSAIFSSEATRSFYYETNYTELLQLPLDSSIYFLIHESSVRNYQDATGIVDSCEVLGQNSFAFCYIYGTAPDACTISEAMAQKQEEIEILMRDTDSHRGIIQQQVLEEKKTKLSTFLSQSSYLCANIESLRRVLLKPKNSLTFLMKDHDFQKYWQLFVQVMENDRKIAVANNFFSDDSLLAQPVGFYFTSGLYPALKGSVVSRFKLLLSSGIYGLWEKWSRIKLSAAGLQYTEKKLLTENKVEPVSFDNSATPWIFRAQACAWLMATAILIVETIVKYFHFVRVSRTIE